MNISRLVAASLALPIFVAFALAQAPPLPVLDDKPTPQVDAGGPSAAVNVLAFGADGETLYAAGLDKVVRIWTLQKGRFVLKTTYRVPIGPGNGGGVNAVALSPDGAWLAMAGRAPMRGEVGFRQGGVIVESAALSPEQNLDAGVIYVASTANPAGGKVLRGHRGEVRALAFAPASKGKPPLLVSAATERDGAKRFGGVRLWDVAAGKMLAERSDLPAKVTRPGLAVWSTGPEATQVRVAIAWPDEQDADTKGSLRLWDPSPNANPMQVWKTDPYSQTAALLGSGDVLTGGYRAPTGRLRAWHFSSDRETRATLSEGAEFPPRDKVHFLPVSLTVFSTRGTAPTHAAVVLQPSSRELDFRLALVDLRTNRVVANLPLAGSDKTQLPAVAASGKYLAVAATRDHAVRVYAVADLLADNPRPVVLAGEGLAPKQVAFVDKGRGLWLSEDGQARPLRGGLIFDIDKRQVRANDAPLTADAPEMGEWSFTIDEDRKGVTVRQGKKELPPVRLQGKDEVVTKAALRPAAPGRPAVLAVAYTERDASRTLIMLCDPANGKPYRLLVSHLQDVRDLAFSASRPLLASVADDETLCVWSLADLDRAVGQVSGLGVGDEGKKVVIRRVEAGSAAAKASLEEGDVLEKVGAPGGAAKPIKDAADFLLAVSARRPGDQVEVTVARKGAVKLPVERGVDERKPLFSLFLLRTPKLPEWVGWSPAGPYDYSSPAAESHLGWHTNTGDPANPVSYVAARAYQKDYYREGILRYLAAEADLVRALKKWDEDHPEKPPEASLRPIRPDAVLPTNRVDEYFTRQAIKTLRFGINDDYKLDNQHVLRWRVTRTDGGKVTADAAEISGQAAREGKEWQADLSGVGWRRGDYQIRVALHPQANKPEVASTTVTFRFQPPAPTLALSMGGKAVMTTEEQPLKVVEDKLTLQVAVKVPAGQEVQVQFAQFRNGVTQKNPPTARVQTGAGEFEQVVKLQEGVNHLTVRAVNKGALTDHEDEEAATAEVWISYKAPHEAPPRFTDLQIKPDPEVKRLKDKEVWVVNRPAVRLTGKIEAAGDLVQADWSTGGAAKSVMPARKGKTAALAIDLELKAGEEVTVTLRAKSEHSDLNTVQHSIVFYPPLPDITIASLDSPNVLTEKIALTGTFDAATKDSFDLSFRVTTPDKKPKEFKAEMDVKARTWKVELTLFPGSNTIKAIVGNKWRGEQAGAGAFTLNYRRPPQITAFPKQVEAVETNKVKLAITVEGPADRPLTGIKVDGDSVKFEPGKPETKDGRSVWKVELPEVFVNDDDNQKLDKVSIQAVTDEGTSPAAVVRVVHKMLPRLPSVRFVTPATDTTSPLPTTTVTFQVESEQPLERVEISRGDEVYQADLTKVEQVGKRYILQGEAKLTLKNGPNTLELIAVNTDGRSPRAKVIVSYTQPPVLVSIDRVELLTEKGDVEKVFKPTFQSDGSTTFPASPNNLVWLVGRVRWSDPKATALDDRGLEVAVKVKDVRQFPVALGPRGKGDEANVRPFRVPIVLIDKKNKIIVEVPSVAQQDLSGGQFELASTAEPSKQRLHVLIVGVNVKDSAELKKRVLDALCASPNDRPQGAQGEFYKKPPFERCVLYHVLAGEVERGQVEAQLVEINNEITRLKRETGWLNDLVLIYYQGEDYEVPGKNELWLKTSRNFQFPKAPVEAFAIPSHALPRVPGAPLLLLNVAGPANVRSVGSGLGGSGVGFLRYSSPNPKAVATADSPVLDLLQQAISEKGRLGDVVEAVKTLAAKMKTISPSGGIDADLASRFIGPPTP